MALIYKHFEVDRERIERLERNPDSVTEPGDLAVLDYLTRPAEQRKYALGRYVIGRFDTGIEDESGEDVLHTGSFLDESYQVVARGKVIEDLEQPDGLYQVYVPI